VWSLDFVSDQLAHGRRFRALTVVNIYTRESLAIEAGPGLKGADVVRVLNHVKSRHGSPQFLFCDNGSEFTGQAMDFWAHENQVRIDFSRPGKPRITHSSNLSTEPSEANVSAPIGSLRSQKPGS
jgi:putative transposase